MDEGCACATCMLSRANQRQSKRIKALQGSLDRVRQLCTEPGYLAVEEVLTAIDGPGDDKRVKQAVDQPKAKRSIVSVPLPE